MTSQPPDPAPDAPQAGARHDARPDAPAAEHPDAPAAEHPDAPKASPGVGAVEYKGGPLDPEKGPGLGCFWLQVIVLAIVVVLTPLAAAWNWPIPVVIVLLAVTIVLLLFVGQTIIFLLRLVAADRRAEARRRPLRSRTKTVGELEDEARAESGGADPPEADDEGVRE
ncbi:MAG TPA: hypothetical protein VNL94_00485 [Candidatus Binatia bacterium]|nr:hypothetical protein [Candidatus Binatia bacterium]